MIEKEHSKGNLGKKRKGKQHRQEETKQAQLQIKQSRCITHGTDAVKDNKARNEKSYKGRRQRRNMMRSRRIRRTTTAIIRRRRGRI